MLSVKTKSIVEVVGVDIGIFIKGEMPTSEELEEAVRRGSEKLPLQFRNDSFNRVFPVSLLCYKLPNGEDVHRDWLAWSKSKEALFCFPCRLFIQSSMVNRSLLASSTGYSKDNKWKKLYINIPEHQESMNHKRCLCCVEKSPKGYWMQRHNFTAVT